jgi:phosphopantothenoylcysteine synthetase/decarboxylase
MSTRRLLIGVCGSGNLVVLPQHLLAIRASCDVEIRAVMTRSAATMLSDTTLRMLCDEVYRDGVDDMAVNHVELVTWAHRVVVIPATANILGQVSHGLASGLLTSALLAAPSPILFFPAMNRRMWTNLSVQRNVAQLRADGHIVREPAMDRAWEVASRSMQINPGLPAAVPALVTEFLAPVDPAPPRTGDPVNSGGGSRGRTDSAR